MENVSSSSFFGALAKEVQAFAQSAGTKLTKTGKTVTGVVSNGAGAAATTAKSVLNWAKNFFSQAGRFIAQKGNLAIDFLKKGAAGIKTLPASSFLIIGGVTAVVGFAVHRLCKSPTIAAAADKSGDSENDSSKKAEES